ncbi:unnamed protein product [Blepharisma stoltei]|uniref:Uncharacterized protein n=1 Tax=Blepharisma stoltei TaxID=1481888 RepID=A0AAU9JXA0_9CILI|nr:unnamed protein product [Blepharisma stoltei]
MYSLCCILDNNFRRNSNQRYCMLNNKRFLAYLHSLNKNYKSYHNIHSLLNLSRIQHYCKQCHNFRLLID